MTPLVRESGLALGLPSTNIDTDQLIPARFMKEPRRPLGYGRFLLHDQPEATAALAAAGPAVRVLVAGRNFGCGSSREAAVYALADRGIRAVFAPSFGDIFAGNAANNGLLAATLPEDTVAALLPALDRGAEATVDLEAQTLRIGSAAHAFAVDPVVRTKLLNGWDDIDLTASHAAAIAAFCDTDARHRPWAAPGEGSAHPWRAATARPTGRPA